MEIVACVESWIKKKWVFGRRGSVSHQLRLINKRVTAMGDGSGVAISAEGGNAN